MERASPRPPISPSTSVPPRPYYGPKQIADFVGVSMSRFYRNKVRESLYVGQGLPRPYCTEPLRWDRASVDAWRLRNHPACRGQQPANDLVALPPAATDAEHQAELHEIYGDRRRA